MKILAVVYLLLVSLLLGFDIASQSEVVLEFVLKILGSLTLAAGMGTAIIYLTK